MCRIVDTPRNVAAAITKRLPLVRGLARACGTFNRITLGLGASPVVDTTMRDGTRMRLDLRTTTEFNAYYIGVYDAALIDLVKEIYHPDQIFLDIGGNIGFYTVAMGAHITRRNGSGRIITFEPHPGNFVRLMENIRLNRIDGHCTAFQFGLSDKDRTEQLSLGEDFTTGSATGNAAILPGTSSQTIVRSVSIKLRRLDDVIAEHPLDGQKVDFIKMDIEGHEDYCLKGGQQLLQTHRPTILMEVNKPYYRIRSADMDSTFFPLLPDGYEIYRHTGDNWTVTRSLEECMTVDNVILAPKEKLTLERYRRLTTRR